MSDQTNFAAAFNKTPEELLAMDETEFRARFRERCHHTMEIQVYSHAYRGTPLRPEQPRTARMFMEVWRQRGLSQDLPEYVYASKILEFAETLIQGNPVDLSRYRPAPLSEEEYRGFMRGLYELRSVREWTEQRVPDELIEKVLDAGLWAAHACNLQSIRYRCPNICW